MVKTHGKRGEVVTVPVHGLPPLLHVGMTVALVPPALKESRWHEVVDVSTTDAGQLVAFSGSKDISSAEGLVGKTVLADVAELPEGYELHDIDALIGLAVYDEVHGDLGAISDVMVGSAQDVWVVEGPYGEVLIPAVEEFVLGRDEDGTIVVRVPDGIVPDEDIDDGEA